MFWFKKKKEETDNSEFIANESYKLLVEEFDDYLKLLRNNAVDDAKQHINTKEEHVSSVVRDRVCKIYDDWFSGYMQVVNGNAALKQQSELPDSLEGDDGIS